MKRLRKVVKISFNKKKYEKCLSNLRGRNEDLNVLRTQIGSFQQPAAAANALVNQKALPDKFHAIQSASNKLHEALCEAWCCDDVAHRAHYAKLCLDAEVGLGVRLDLAISCNKSTDDDSGCVWVLIRRSQSCANAGSGSQSIPPMCRSGCMCGLSAT